MISARWRVERIRHGKEYFNAAEEMFDVIRLLHSTLPIIIAVPAILGLNTCRKRGEIHTERKW